MAKKKKKHDDGSSKADEIMDSLAEEVGADEANADPASEGEEQEAASKAPVSVSKGRKGFTPWPVDPGHESVTDMLMGAGGDPDVVIDDDPEPGVRKRGVVNLILVVLVLGAAIGGGYGLAMVSSEEALAEKRAAAAEAEELHLEEQLAKQKKYGNLRIETIPAGATVFQDGQKSVEKDPESGQEVVVTTPTNVLNLDISEAYKFRLELEGYEPFDFTVAEHLWTKQGEDYSMLKSVLLVPLDCEYWFLYDTEKKREVKFEDRASCIEHDKAAGDKQGSGGKCACKRRPEGADSTADAK